MGRAGLDRPRGSASRAIRPSYLGTTVNWGRTDQLDQLVTRTLPIVSYDHDDEEFRIHLVVHARADRSRVALDEINW